MRMKFATKPIWHYPPHLRHVAALPWEIKNSNFLQMWKKTQTDCIFNRLWLYLSTNFDISVFKIASLSPDWLWIKFPSHCSFTYLLLPSVCADTEENVETVNDLVLSQEDKPQTHRTVREISRVFIGRLCLGLFVRTCILNVSYRCRAQELTDANCAAGMKRAKLLLQKFPQSATDFVFFTDEKMFAFASPNWQNKVSGRLRELLKKKLSVFFCASTARSAAAAWPPLNCACVPQLFEQLINTTVCPAFLRKLVCQPLCCVPLQIQTCY